MSLLLPCRLVIKRSNAVLLLGNGRSINSTCRNAHTCTCTHTHQCTRRCTRTHIHTYTCAHSQTSKYFKVLHLPFRLYLVTPSPVEEVPAEVSSLVSLVLYYPEREGVAELLLDRFLQLQNPKTSQERVQLREVRKQGGLEGGKEGGRDGEWEGGRERGRDLKVKKPVLLCVCEMEREFKGSEGRGRTEAAGPVQELS